MSKTAEPSTSSNSKTIILNLAQFYHVCMMNQRLESLIESINRLARVAAYSFRIQPYYYLVVTLLRTTIRLLYFSAAVLPFKILMVISSDFTVPSFLSPYFPDKFSLAYALCMFIALAMLTATGLEKWVEYIAKIKAKTLLGDEYSSKYRKRNKLSSYILKSTEVSSSVIIIVFSMALLLIIQYEIALVVIALSLVSLLVFLFSKGKLNEYIEGSTKKYLNTCLTGISLISFFALVQITITSTTPIPFLFLLLSLILTRQYTQSVGQVVAVALFFKNKDFSIERVFTKL